MNIGFILFPNLTQLDFTGPLQVLFRAPGAKTHILAKTMEPVPSDCGLALVPTGVFADTPKLDLICVPGGFGVIEACEDAETRAFVAKAGSEAQYVTSVCTGALLLGAAGLLRGKRATTHWAYRSLLSQLGAIHAEGRVVRDGNTFTGGGVTAGIDFAFTLLSELWGPEVAARIKLAIEYDPTPGPGGHPDSAEPDVLASMRSFYQQRVEENAARLAALDFRSP
jgi:cyclohexyl-isocyanide hydratase